MQRSFAFLGAGIIIGAIAVLMLRSPTDGNADLDVERDLVAPSQLDDIELDKHRDQNYRQLRTVTDILSLPGDFAREEAAFALAGRSDSGAVQSLIADASRIADSDSRRAILDVFFSRLVDVDPRSALAVSRFEQFRYETDIERQVWIQWARRDLDSALFEAGVQGTLPERYRAAQALFAAHGHYDNPVVDRIRDALQIDPDSANQSLFIQDLVDRSPEEAIAYVNAMLPSSTREDMVRYLAGYLGMSDPEAALAYEAQFEDADLRAWYRRTLISRMAEHDPVAVMEDLLAAPRTMQHTSQMHVAMRALTKRDINLAMHFFERISNPRERSWMSSLIMQELVARDIDLALQWAEDNSLSGMPQLSYQVLALVAQRDPQRAFDEALASDNASMRQHLLQSVIGTIARNDPELAIRKLQELPDDMRRGGVAGNMLANIVSSDPEAAVAWLQSLPPDEARKFLSSNGSLLAQMSADVAMQLMPLAGEKTQSQWRLQLAQQIAMTRSPEEAFNFIRQFDGSEDYDELQGIVVGAVAQSDPVRAMQLASNMPDGEGKDRALMTIVGTTAVQSPHSAVELLDQIADPQARKNALTGVAHQWVRRDQQAALRWVQEMPVGTDRDQAIAAMAGFLHDSSVDVDNLINSISDPHRRSEAKVQRATRHLTSDPARVRAYLEDPDILPEHKDQLRRYLERTEAGRF